MKSFKPVFATAALASLFTFGIQQTDFALFTSNVAVANAIDTAIEQDSVTINVYDYEETVQWYRDNLNATLEREWTVPELPNVKLANLNVRGQKINVVGSVNPPIGVSQVANLNEYLGNVDYAGLIRFPVTDVDAVMNELAARGVPALIETADYPRAAQRIAFVEDNNGNFIEFSQPIDRSEFSHFINFQ